MARRKFATFRQGDWGGRREMTASNVGLRMMTEEATVKGVPLTQNFIRTLHKTILREDYTVYRDLLGGMQTSYEFMPASIRLGLTVLSPDMGTDSNMPHPRRHPD